MPAFANQKELVTIMIALWEAIKADPKMSDDLLKSKLCVQFRYRDPEGIITVDCSDGEDMKISSGDSELKPDIEMSMRGDVAHDFWTGRLGAPAALLTGKIVSRGPTPKALALLPVIKPAFAIYTKVYDDFQKAPVV